ncbi:MAG: MFS transporter, partial [bacterium]
RLRLPRTRRCPMLCLKVSSMGRYLILGLYSLVGISMSTILFAVPLKALDLGASELTLGSLVSALVATGLVFSFGGAALCGRLGERILLAGAFGSYALAQVMGALAGSATWLMLSAATAGVGDMLFTIGGMTYLTETARRKGEEILISVSFSVLRIGSVVGSAVAGYFAESFGFAVVFLIGALISLGGVFLSLLLPRLEASSLPQLEVPSGTLASYRVGYGLLRENSTVRTAAVLTCLSTVGWFTFNSSFYLDHLNRVGMPKGTIGLVVAGGSAASVVAPFVYVWLTRWTGPLSVILSGMLCAGLGLAVTPLFSSPGTLGLIGFAARMGDTFRQPGVFSLLSAHTDPSDRPVSVAIINTSWAVAALCAGPTWGLIARVAGPLAPFLTAGLGTTIAAAILWALDRRGP